MMTICPPRCGCDGSDTSPEIVVDPVPVVIVRTQLARASEPDNVSSEMLLDT